MEQNAVIDPELSQRLEGLDSIIHGLYQNHQLMEFLSFNLHKETYNLFNNHGLYWILERFDGATNY